MKAKLFMNLVRLCNVDGSIVGKAKFHVQTSNYSEQVHDALRLAMQSSQDMDKGILVGRQGLVKIALCMVDMTNVAKNGSRLLFFHWNCGGFMKDL